MVFSTIYFHVYPEQIGEMLQFDDVAHMVQIHGLEVFNHQLEKNKKRWRFHGIFWGKIHKSFFLSRGANIFLRWVSGEIKSTTY